MKFLCIISVFFLSVFSACAQKPNTLINNDGKSLTERIITPIGFDREKLNTGSFAYYLRTLPLKPHNYKVRFFNGIIKPNFWVYDAVIDIDVGERDLQQCADAVMRLKAEYLYNSGQFNQIHFNFTNGFRVDYYEWMKGNRIVVEGNKTYWKKLTGPSNTYTDFRKYMNIIFSYAGTLSLAKELTSVNINDLIASSRRTLSGSSS